MASAWKSASVAVLIALAIPPALAFSPATIPRTDDVWIRTSLGINLSNRTEIENATFAVHSGATLRPGLAAFNNLSVPIQNVTLVVIPRNTTASFTLGATFAGDPAQEVFARWPMIPPGEDRITPMLLSVPASPPGPIAFECLLFFQLPDGTSEYSLTTLHFNVQGGSVIQMAAADARSLMTWVAAAAGFVAGIALTVALVRMSKTHNSGGSPK